MNTKQLTAEDIDLMEVGPEMDALVGARVMGWQQFDTGSGWWQMPTTLGVGRCRDLPHYSTNIAAAWQVVKAVATDMINFYIVHYAYNRTYACFVHVGSTAWDDDLLIGEGNGEYADCEAICKAALKATLTR